jgi:hypothetical protein
MEIPGGLTLLTQRTLWLRIAVALPQPAETAAAEAELPPAEDPVEPVTLLPEQGAAYGPGGEPAADPGVTLRERIASADLRSPSTRNAFRRLAERLMETPDEGRRTELAEVLEEALARTEALEEEGLPFGRSVERKVKQLVNAAAKRNPHQRARFARPLRVDPAGGAAEPGDPAPVMVPVEPPEPRVSVPDPVDPGAGPAGGTVQAARLDTSV